MSDKINENDVNTLHVHTQSSDLFMFTNYHIDVPRPFPGFLWGGSFCENILDFK